MVRVSLEVVAAHDVCTAGVDPVGVAVRLRRRAVGPQCVHHAERSHLESWQRVLARAADETDYAWYRLQVGRQRRVASLHHRAGVAQGVRDAGARREPVYRFVHSRNFTTAVSSGSERRSLVVVKA